MGAYWVPSVCGQARSGLDMQMSLVVSLYFFQYTFTLWAPYLNTVAPAETAAIAIISPAASLAYGIANSIGFQSSAAETDFTRRRRLMGSSNQFEATIQNWAKIIAAQFSGAGAVWNAIVNGSEELANKAKEFFELVGDKLGPELQSLYKSALGKVFRPGGFPFQCKNVLTTPWRCTGYWPAACRICRCKTRCGSSWGRGCVTRCDQCCDEPVCKWYVPASSSCMDYITG
jgi:hypothetical protein